MAGIAASGKTDLNSVRYEESEGQETRTQATIPCESSDYRDHVITIDAGDRRRPRGKSCTHQSEDVLMSQFQTKGVAHRQQQRLGVWMAAGVNP